MSAKKKKKRKLERKNKDGRDRDSRATCGVMRERERAFAMEFLRTHDAAKAGRAASIRVNSPKSICTFLKRPGVQEIINDEMAMRGKAVGITVDRVLNELAALAFTVMTDYASWTPSSVSLTDSSALTREQARAIQTVSSKMSAQGVPNISVKLYDKVKALELLAKYLGIITPDADGGKRPQAQELALRIRALVRAADEKTGGVSEKEEVK